MVSACTAVVALAARQHCQLQYQQYSSSSNSTAQPLHIWFCEALQTILSQQQQAVHTAVPEASKLAHSKR
eukprot:17454-Heterococcus_DN1.PRE.2